MREAHELRTEVMSSLEYVAQIRVVSTEDKADTSVKTQQRKRGKRHVVIERF